MVGSVCCLPPPAAMLIFAIKTKKSFEALIFGALILILREARGTEGFSRMVIHFCKSERIVVPLIIALNGNILLVLSAVVSGGVFGSHACFYSDATVLSSATCEIDNMDHAVTQAPYAITGAVLAVIAYLVAGFAM